MQLWHWRISMNLLSSFGADRCTDGDHLGNLLEAAWSQHTVAFCLSSSTTHTCRRLIEAWTGRETIQNGYKGAWLLNPASWSHWSPAHSHESEDTRLWLRPALRIAQSISGDRWSTHLATNSCAAITSAITRQNIIDWFFERLLPAILPLLPG